MRWAATAGVDAGRREVRTKPRRFDRSGDAHEQVWGGLGACGIGTKMGSQAKGFLTPATLQGPLPGCDLRPLRT